MSGNKEAYEAAYQRALHGKSRTVGDLLGRVFEDEYTRQSREKGERDGLAAREAAQQAEQMPAAQV